MHERVAAMGNDQSLVAEVYRKQPLARQSRKEKGPPPLNFAKQEFLKTQISRQISLSLPVTQVHIESLTIPSLKITHLENKVFLQGVNLYQLEWGFVNVFLSCGRPFFSS
jgi:hypothetical protein